MIYFPKTIPIPEITMRLKEFQLLGYQVCEVDAERYIVFQVVGEGIHEMVLISAGYRKKRNKKFYLDKRMMEPDLEMISKLTKSPLMVGYNAKELWWNSRRG